MMKWLERRPYITGVLLGLVIMSLVTVGARVRYGWLLKPEKRTVEDVWVQRVDGKVVMGVVYTDGAYAVVDVPEPDEKK